MRNAMIAHAVAAIFATTLTACNQSETPRKTEIVDTTLPKIPAIAEPVPPSQPDAATAAADAASAASDALAAAQAAAADATAAAPNAQN